MRLWIGLWMRLWIGIGSGVRVGAGVRLRVRMRILMSPVRVLFPSASVLIRLPPIIFLRLGYCCTANRERSNPKQDERHEDEGE